MGSHSVEGRRPVILLLDRSTSRRHACVASQSGVVPVSRFDSERERAEQRQIAKLARHGALELVPPETNLRELRGVRQRRGHRSRQTITGEVQPRKVHRGPERGWDGPRERVGSKPQRR